jgi:hypothetical protein
MSGTLAKLTSRPLPSDELPTSFLLFSPGANANYNADRQGEPHPKFTARSAARVRDAAARKASDYFLDLEHASLRSDGAPGSTDAMAWFSVDLRADGSCWAVNVRWTPEGARRLRAKSQRFVSPVFRYSDTGEVTELVGCALTSDPATYGAAPLVAASRKPAPIRSAVLSTKVPAVTRVAFGLLALQHNVTPSALLRRLVERADWLGADRVATLARSPADLETLLDLLDLDRGATPDQIVAAVEAFLESLPAGVPASAAPDVPTDAAADSPDPPKPDPVAAARHAMRVAAMDPIQRDRFLRSTLSMARDRAAQLRPRGAGARTSFSPAVRAQLATMTREQRARFDTIISNRRK